MRNKSEEKIKAPKPSHFWWKCSGCDKVTRRNKRTFGACFCWGCDTVQAPKAMLAQWGHEWAVVAWMAKTIDDLEDAAYGYPEWVGDRTPCD